MPGLPLRLGAKCGTLTVYEDRKAQAGRQIELNIAVVPTSGRDRASEPLFFLTGGPGQAATESYLQLLTAFSLLNQSRDIVLVDQRGTGESNPLRCDEADVEHGLGEIEDEGEQGLGEIEDELRVKLLEGCLERLEADVRLYTTAIAVEDLEAVRQALGYGQINLYGLSYGTRVALSYMRQYPDAIRAVILDGVVPPDEVLGMEVARDAQRALALIWARCLAESTCQEAFPNIREEWEALLTQLSQQPVELTLDHPTTGLPTKLLFTRDELAMTVRLLSYAPETAALLPLLVSHAQQRSNLETIAAQYLMISDSLSSSISDGMSTSVLCSEDAAFLSAQEAAAANAGTYYGDIQIKEFNVACSVWPRGDIPPNFHEPVISDIPTLLLSGEVDPVTPPENGRQVAQTLSNSLHLIAPGQGHNVIPRGCLPLLADDFLETASFTELETSCVEEIVPMPFFIELTGPPP
jgi:pimeloyl-ACP methyl ester carboxylesterase